MTSRWRVGVLTLALACWAAPVKSAGPFTFDFEGFQLGTFTPFSQTVSGVTATFSSPLDLTGPKFSVQNATTATNVQLSTFSGQFLYPNALGVAPLTITFSEPVNSVSLNFAVVEQHFASSMYLDAFLGGTLVGSTIGPSAYIDGDSYPQGTVTFSGTAFNRIELSVPPQGTEPRAAFFVDTVTINTVGPPAAALQASWQFDELDGDTVTSSIGGYVGQLGSAAGPDANDPAWIPGRTSGGLEFDGTQYVVVPDAAGLSPETVTVEAWVRSPFTQGFQAHVIGKGANDTCTAGSYALRAGNTGGLEFVVHGPAGQILVSPETVQPVFDNQWHFIVGTFDRSTARLFVDGTEVGTGTTGGAAFSIAYSASDQRLAIGSYPAAGCNFSFKGEIDQPGIWSGALTAAEVALRFQMLNVPFATQTALMTQPSGSSRVGEPVLLRADVTSSAGIAPTGSVEFFDGTSSLGSVPLVSGRAELTVTTFTEGVHSLAALYTPEGLFELSGSASVIHTVLPATPTDTVPPVVTLVAPATVEATGANGAPITFTATATDNQDPAPVVTCNRTSGDIFPLGDTTISCTATDASGNVSAPATATVRVADTTAPALTVPAPIAATASAPAGVAVTFAASAVDLVDGTIVPVCAPASGSVFPLGETPVTCTAADAHGNTGTASFTVTVTLVDTTPPVVTVPAPITTEATSAAGAVVTFAATAVDDLDGPLTAACSPASGATFALGATTVTCSATDKAGNTGTASFAVTVADTTPPALTVPAPIGATASAPTGIAVTFAASAVDLVDGTIVPVCAPASGSVFPVGETSVTCTAADAHGNSASASFTITVTFVDTTPPVVTVPADITVEAASAAGSVVTFTATAVDNSGGPLTAACSPASGATFALGATTVTCSATDSHGNTGTASFKVKVTDTTPPTAPAWLPATNITAKTATLNWVAAEHAVGAPTYRIYEQIRKQGGPATWQLLAAGLTGTSFTPAEFRQRNFEHVFYIVAVDAADNVSVPSGELVVQLPKPAGR